MANFPFQRLQADLAKLIAETPAGARLMSEPDLAKQMGVSRATLREAMRTFETQGLIRRRQGSGTYVVGKFEVIDAGLEVRAAHLPRLRAARWARADGHERPEAATEPVFPAATDSLRFGDLEVLAEQRRDRFDRGGARVDSVVYEVTTFALDSAFVPPIPVHLSADADTFTGCTTENSNRAAG